MPSTGSTPRSSNSSESMTPRWSARGRHNAEGPAPPPATTPAPGPLVSFARSSHVAAHWNESAEQSLLELAEACDVPVRWSCRTGVCHNCESGLVSGAVVYGPEPLDRPAEGNTSSFAAHDRPATSSSTCDLSRLAARGFQSRPQRSVITKGETSVRASEALAWPPEDVTGSGAIAGPTAARPILGFVSKPRVPLPEYAKPAPLWHLEAAQRAGASPRVMVDSSGGRHLAGTSRPGAPAPPVRPHGHCEPGPLCSSQPASPWPARRAASDSASKNAASARLLRRWRRRTRPRERAQRRRNDRRQQDRDDAHSFKGIPYAAPPVRPSPLEGAAEGRAADRHARRHQVRERLRSGPESVRHGFDGRRLSLPERVRADGQRAVPGHVLDSRRRVPERRVQRVRPQQAGRAGRRRRDDQLPARNARLPDKRGDRQRRGRSLHQLRLARSAARAAVGAGQHRELQRRQDERRDLR